MNAEPRPTYTGAELRAERGSKLLNRVDPVYFLLDHLVFAPFFSPRLLGKDLAATTLEVPEVVFLLSNLRKHRTIIWANILATVAILGSGLTSLGPADLSPLLPGLAAPVVVSGIAWYTISFSGVPERFGRHAMLVTGVLFLAVSFSLTTLILVLGELTPPSVAGLVLIPIYLALYVSAIIYDNLDGLRAAAAKEGLVLSRAQAYTALPDPLPQTPSEATSRKHDSARLHETSASLKIETFNELTTRLDRLLEELAAKQGPLIANVLIADCLSHVLRLLSLTNYPLTLDGGFHDFLSQAHHLPVAKVNELAATHLRVIIERVHAILGDPVAQETSAMLERLREIDRLRSDPLGSRKEEASFSRSEQELADFLFVEVMRQLASMMRANRIHLLPESGVAQT